MRMLFLDDQEYRHQVIRQNTTGYEIDHAYDAEQALRLMRSNEYDVVLLDHDLDGGNYTLVQDQEKNGTYVARKMMEESLCDGSVIYVHSLNPAGRANMVSILHGSGYEVYDQPFAWEMQFKVD